MLPYTYVRAVRNQIGPYFIFSFVVSRNGKLFLNPYKFLAYNRRVQWMAMLNTIYIGACDIS